MKIFEKEYISINTNVKTKEGAMTFIANMAENLGISNSASQTQLDLHVREKECNTALGDMIAIPHTKSSSINFPVILIIKPKSAIDWGGEEVQLIISFLSPKENTNNIHLTMLSKISRKLMDEEFKTTLIKSSDTDLIYKMVTNALNS